MKTRALDRYASLELKNGKILRNRVIVPPMASQTADDLGFVTDQTLAHYRRLAQSRASLVIAEYSYVHLTGKSEDRQLGIAEDEQIPGLAALAQEIQTYGALAGIQLTHSGGKSERQLTGGTLMGPSDVAVPVKDRELERPDPMSGEEIRLWIHSFAEAADRAVRSGFDLIELHSAHGYGLNQWLSPLTNLRQDEYGGDLRGRMRLLLEIVRMIRSSHPKTLLSVRVPGQDFMEGGLSISDTIQLSLELEREGVDLIHVSSGIGGWRRPSPRVGEGYLVAEASKIQEHLTVPVIGVGGIETGAYINQALMEGKFSLAAVGRAILSDPHQWGSLNLN